MAGVVSSTLSIALAIQPSAEFYLARRGSQGECMASVEKFANRSQRSIDFDVRRLLLFDRADQSSARADAARAARSAPLDRGAKRSAHERTARRRRQRANTTPRRQLPAREGHASARCHRCGPRPPSGQCSPISDTARRNATSAERSAVLDRLHCDQLAAAIRPPFPAAWRSIPAAAAPD